MRLIGRKKRWIRVVNGGAGHKSPAVTSGAACYVVGERAELLGKAQGPRGEPADGRVTYQERCPP
jgi:hypothetical protein